MVEWLGRAKGGTHHRRLLVANSGNLFYTQILSVKYAKTCAFEHKINKS